MIKKNVDGTDLYFFEPSEESIRAKFLQSSLVEEDMVNALLEALIKAFGKIHQERKDGWKYVAEKISEIENDPTIKNAKQIHYHWINDGFFISNE